MKRLRFCSILAVMNARETKLNLSQILHNIIPTTSWVEFLSDFSLFFFHFLSFFAKATRNFQLIISFVYMCDISHDTLKMCGYCLLNRPFIRNNAFQHKVN